jgi:hypothetical protein
LSNATNKLAVCTTIYPGVERYLNEWYASILTQTDVDFDLWIGLDSLHPVDVEAAVGSAVEADWMQAAVGSTPADVRQQTLAHVVERYAAVVFVDADDVLLESRVEAARAQLEHADVGGCGMRLVQEDGSDLGVSFAVPLGVRVPELLPRLNAFGLSNSAYRTDVLASCLPIPTGTAIVDWYLSTRAWLAGATFHFDQAARMLYRQHSVAACQLIPPFTHEQVITATRTVIAHYESLLRLPERTLEPRWDRLAHELARAKHFRVQIEDDQRLALYVEGLNKLEASHVWWACVAHPDLEDIWDSN